MPTPEHIDACAAVMAGINDPQSWMPEEAFRGSMRLLTSINPAVLAALAATLGETEAGQDAALAMLIEQGRLREERLSTDAVTPDGRVLAGEGRASVTRVVGTVTR